jgi:hypothetical protein
MTRQVVGKGIDSLFSDIREKPAESELHTSEAENNKSIRQSMQVENQKSDSDLIDQAISEALIYPKISVYSPFVAAILRYKQLTVIRFRMSDEGRRLLEKALEEEYPEICEKIKRREKEFYAEPRHSVQLESKK